MMIFIDLIETERKHFVFVYVFMYVFQTESFICFSSMLVDISITLTGSLNSSNILLIDILHNIIYTLTCRKKGYLISQEIDSSVSYSKNVNANT